MKGFFEPQGIAVVGASSNPQKGGFALISNLKEKFAGKLYPINPGHEEVCGLPTFRSVLELPHSPDLAIIFVNAEAVPSVLDECGRKGIRRVMIQSAGFAETGDRGVQLQKQCVSIARKYSIRIWGPELHGNLRRALWDGGLLYENGYLERASQAWECFTHRPERDAYSGFPGPNAE